MSTNQTTSTTTATSGVEGATKDITKLSKKLENASDFQAWKWTMTLMFRAHGVMEVVDGTKEEPAITASSADKDEFERLNTKALLLMAANVEPNQMAYIMPYQLAAKAWAELHRVYQQNNLAFQFYLRSKWESLRQEEGEGVQAYAKKTRELIFELRGGQIEVAEQEAILKMLRGVLPKYKQVATTLQFSGQRLTIDLVEASLRAAELQGDGEKGGSTDTPPKAFMSKGGRQDRGGKRKETRKCFFCKKEGHLKKDCFAFKKHQKEEEGGKDGPDQQKEQSHHVLQCWDEPPEVGGEVALNTSTKESPLGKWYVDSGATRHLCSQAELLTGLEEETNVKKIYVGDGSSLEVKGRGTVNLQLGEGQKRSTVEIRDVLFVPKLAANLLSVPQLVEKGVHVSFGKMGCTLSYRGQQLGVARKENKLYCLQATHQQEDDSRLWHDRFGHPGHQALKQVLEGEYVQGLPKGLTPTEGTCEGCLKGKQARKPFPATARRREEEPLALTHIDLCGPMQVDSLGGAKYMMLLVDDATRHKTVFLLKNKGEAADYIMFYQRSMEAALGKTMKEIRTDRGGEFLNTKLGSYLSGQGIRHNLTAPYSPHQNGVAERGNRTIMEAARSMMHAKGVDYRLWGEAVRTAARLRNMIPGKKQKKTPSELFWGKQPKVSFLRTWGCKSHVHVPDAKRQKLDAKSLTCIFVGYEPSCKAWRFYHPPTKSLIVSKDAIFAEGERVDWREVSKDPFTSELQGLEGLEVIYTPAAAPPPPEGGEPEPQQGGVEDEGPQPDPVQGDEPHELEVQEPGGLDQPQQEDASQASRSMSVEGVPRSRIAGWERDRPPKRVRSINEMVQEGEGAVLAFLGKAEEIPIPKSYQEAMASPHKDRWLEAMKWEMESIITNGTWELKPLPKGRKSVGCKWVYDLKRDKHGNILRFKARLVAKGFSQRPGEDYNETFAPVARFATVRVMLTLAAQRGWGVRHLDVKTAFLHGLLSEEIYMDQPLGFEAGESGMYCHLLKSLYGLKQASRAWHQRLRQELEKLGLQGADEDPSLFYTPSKNLYLLVYVDDMLVIGAEEDIERLKEGLASSFTLNDLGEASLFLGLELEWKRGDHQVWVQQNRYAKQVLLQFGGENLRPASTPLAPGVKLEGGEGSDVRLQEFQSAVGSLQYLATGTRPDLSFAVGEVSKFLTCPREEHWRSVQHILRYLSSTKDYALVLGATSEGETSLQGYTDADWGANDETRRSISGHTFILGAGAVSWSSKRQQTVALSSTEAEYLALTRATKEALWLQRLLGEIEGKTRGAVAIHVDNLGCIAMAKNPEGHERSKHIDIQAHFVRQHVSNRRVELNYCPTEEMVADIMTKPLPKGKHTWCVKHLGLLQPHQQ